MKEVMNGSTLGRALQSMFFSEKSVKGKGIDLGAKKPDLKYHDYIDKKNTEITYADLNPKSSDIMKLNLEEEIPVEDKTQDFLILSNVLEHVYNHDNCISECCRVLRSGGKLLGVVPFLHRFHPDPEDYYRYTSTCLRQMFCRAGFSKTRIEALGFGPISSSAHLIGHFVRPSIVRAVCFYMSVQLDRTLNSVYPGNPAVRRDYYPIGYGFTAFK